MFKEKSDKMVQGVLKSLVLNAEISKFKNEVTELGNKIAEKYSYVFLGINDVFSVSGEVKQGEILGRTTYYEYNDIKSVNKLKCPLNEQTSKNDNQIKKFKCSLIFFCENDNQEKFAITVLSVLKCKWDEFENKVNELGNNLNFKSKIINMSFENLSKLDFIGIESFEEIDLEYNVFETLYSDFENLEFLTKEIISSRELNNKLKEIFLM